MKTILFFLALFSSHIQATEGILDYTSAPAKGKSSIWTPLFQASWDKLNAQHKGKLIKVEPANPLQSHLDNFKWNEKAVMPKNGYATYAGPATQQFINQTSTAIQQRFGFTPRLGRLVPSAGYASVAVLDKTIQFKKPFFRAKNRSLDFTTTDGTVLKVSYFGTQGQASDKYSSVVQVLNNSNKESSFALSIMTKGDNEKLIIYKPDSAISHKQAIANIAQFMSRPRNSNFSSDSYSQARALDKIFIPYLNVKSDSTYTKQLEGHRYFENEKLPYRIASAFQVVDFKLNEKGAKVRAHSATSDDPFGGARQPPRERHFICNASFFVFIWKKDAKLPYLSTWVDSADLLDLKK